MRFNKTFFEVLAGEARRPSLDWHLERFRSDEQIAAWGRRSRGNRRWGSSCLSFRQNQRRQPHSSSAISRPPRSAPWTDLPNNSYENVKWLGAHSLVCRFFFAQFTSWKETCLYFLIVLFFHAAYLRQHKAMQGQSCTFAVNVFSSANWCLSRVPRGFFPQMLQSFDCKERVIHFSSPKRVQKVVIRSSICIKPSWFYIPY